MPGLFAFALIFSGHPVAPGTVLQYTPTMKFWGAASLLLFAYSLCGQQTARLNRAEQEQFLLRAKVIRTKSAPNGTTGTIRATLTDGTITHDASIQTIDQSKSTFQSAAGVELNFRDSYKYNIAAYRLDKLLDLRMIPPSVERKHSGASAAFTWWVDDFQMEELERYKKKINAPDTAAWNRQMYVVRVFDQLISNVDRNLGNLLITNDWQLWMIDHTRAFRMQTTVRDPKALTECDRNFLAHLKLLDAPTLTREVGSFLTPPEIKGLLARRDQIVSRFEQLGEKVLYDLPRRPE